MSITDPEPDVMKKAMAEIRNALAEPKSVTCPMTGMACHYNDPCLPTSCWDARKPDLDMHQIGGTGSAIGDAEVRTTKDVTRRFPVLGPNESLTLRRGDLGGWLVTRDHWLSRTNDVGRRTVCAAFTTAAEAIEWMAQLTTKWEEPTDPDLPQGMAQGKP